MKPTRRNLSLTVALCASLLTAHALLLGYVAERYVRLMDGRIRLGGFAALAKTLPPPVDPRDRIGDENGAGKAVLATPGLLPMAAMQASQDQPFLSRDPIGAAAVGVEPAESVLPPGPTSGKPAPPPTVFSPPADAPAPSAGVRSPLRDEGGPFISPPPPLTKSDPKTVTESSAAPPPSPPGSETSGASAASADPAPQSDTESDPTSTIGSVDFRPGSTDVQIGRKTKLTRPRLSLAAKADLMTARTRSLVLKLKIDEQGKVTDAEVYQSSGSLAVDQPCQVAAYTWWFEPLKNREGKPMKDVILFTIRFI